MERLIYWIALVLVKVLQILPARVCDQVGQAVGLLAWCIMPGYRGLVCRNMEVAYGEHKTRKEINKLCLEHFRALGANLAGAAHFFGAKEQEIRSHTQLEGINFLLEAHRKGRGVVLAISHIGNWEMFAQACFYVPQVRFGTIYQRIHNRYLDNWLTRIRQKRGVRTFERRSGLNEAVKFLKSGGVLGVLVDQHAGDSGLWTPFFGKLASTSPLAAVLATRTGASVVPVAVFRSGCAFWRICVWPEIPANCSVEELTARINRVLEEQILVSPRDWFWVHNRWKLPRPHFLLANVKRGIYYSPSKNFEKLQKLRILIRTSNWLGDAVMNVPAVRAIRMGRPDLHITILSPEKLVEFWKEIQAGDEVLGIPQSWGALRTGIYLRRYKYDVAIVFPNSFRTGLEVFLAGIPRRVGYRGYWRSWFLNQIVRERKVEASCRPEHHCMRYLELAKQLGAPEFPLESLVPESVKISELWLGVCPGAEYGPAKRWPLERFRKTMEILTTEIGCRWKVFGLEKDRLLGEELAKGFPGVVENLCGKTSLQELMNQIRTVCLLLTNDTGTMHLASLLGVPVVAIFGSTSPELTGPIGGKCRILRKRVECSPCFRRECPLDFRCMTSLHPEEVAIAVKEMISSCSVLA